MLTEFLIYLVTVNVAWGFLFTGVRDGFDDFEDLWVALLMAFIWPVPVLFAVGSYVARHTVGRSEG